MHKRTHTGDRPFACDYEGCSFRCNESSGLTRHKRRHTGKGQLAPKGEGPRGECSKSSGDAAVPPTYEPESYEHPAADVVLMAVASAPSSHAISTFGELLSREGGVLNLADELLDASFATLLVRPPGDPLAGLAQLHLPQRQTFLFAEVVELLPLDRRRAACDSISELDGVQGGIDEAVGWWARSLGHMLGKSLAQSLSAALPPWGLRSLYTPPDGNCLLHALLQATHGVCDTRVPAAHEPGALTPAEILSGARPRHSLRAALHHCIVHCAPMRALLSHHGVPLELTAGIGEGRTVESRSVLDGNSCDPAHVLVLAHIFRRPIVCYAGARVEEFQTGRDDHLLQAMGVTTMSQLAATGARISGIYLPCLLRPNECASRDPILIVYSPGHFSALCSTEHAGEPQVWQALGLAVPTPDPVAPGAPCSPGSIPVPLVDDTLTPLPVLFPPIGVPPDLKLLGSYLDLYITTPVAGPPGTPSQPITVSRQRIPAPADGTLGASPADVYYSAVWPRLVDWSSARQISEQSTVQRPKRGQARQDGGQSSVQRPKRVRGPGRRAPS